MTKAWDEFWYKRQEPVASERAPAPPGHTWVRFTVKCTHCHLPFEAGDEIIVEDHWADRIERIGSGHRITDNLHKES